jgi:hypothetical protein
VYRRLADFDSVPGKRPKRLSPIEMLAAMKKAKKARKVYGVCAWCMKTICLKKNGTLYTHSSALANKCTGSSRKPIMVNIVCPNNHETSYVSSTNRVVAHATPEGTCGFSGTQVVTDVTGRRVESFSDW